MSERPADSAWNRAVRGETEAARADRNFMEVLQELRVTLTGAQILFAFLLVVPFSAAFSRATPLERAIYLSTLLTAALAAGLLVAPAVMHRVVFRQHLKDQLVRTAGALALGGQGLFAVSLALATLLVGDYVYGIGVGAGIAGLVFAWCLAWFFLVPLCIRRSSEAVPPLEGRPRPAPPGR